MRNGFLVLTLAIFCALIVPAKSGVANAAVILKERITYYNVKGRTGREIFKSMIDRGPKLGGRRGHALATTEYEYDVNNIDVIVKNGRCIANQLDVTVHVKYTYPKWIPNGSAKKSTRNAWKVFSKSVIWHEQQHVKIAMDYARDYEAALKKTKLRVSQNCSRASFSSV